MTATDVQDVLSQRTPHLLLDRILELVPNERIIAIKSVSSNDPFFQDDGMSSPVMSGALILETMTQAATTILLSNKDLSGQRPTFSQAQKIEFHRDVNPGDQLRIEVEVTKRKEETITFEGKVLCNDAIVCEGGLLFTLTQQPTKAQIHPTASVHPTAILGKDVIVGPYSIIGENVQIGDKTRIEAHVYIEKWTKIGEENHIHFGSVIGSGPQDMKYQGEKSWVVIGDRNQIREYVTINRATGKNEVTQIGSDNMFLTNVHIGHNCVVGNSTTLANMVHVGGHVVIDDKAIIGGLTGVHQFVRVGRGSMSGGYSRLIQDVPPFMLCDGNPAYVRNLNVVGLRRAGLSATELKELKNAYKLLYRSSMNIKQALEEIETGACETDQIKLLIEFLKEGSSRGISKKTSIEESETD
ncbi:acyl-ACP--UDP-N-acetylglucosamine O-acyltransferase [bacterium]|jgi:UDP-N-acetylglucosamine acyltransferase|nr:acyl-ACP--UDP-N-acetylglucosamine O-acyltransferase [bacterium]